MDVRVGLWRKRSAKELILWTVMLEKTLESPLDCKEIQPVHSKDQSWVFFGRTDAKAETPVLWPPHANGWLTGKDSDGGKDWELEEKGTTEDELARWHHWLDGREFEWTPGVGDAQGGLVCCSSWDRKESNTHLSHPYMTSRKTIALTIWNFVSKVMSLNFNTLSRLVIDILPSNKHLFIL